MIIREVVNFLQFFRYFYLLLPLEGEYFVGNIFFSWTNQSRVLRNIGKREIVDGYKNRKGNVFVHVAAGKQLHFEDWKETNE